jgi:creatinine amidohydrolase
MTKHVLLGKLTRREFRNRMQAGKLRACVIPVAAIEQHLEHLAMEHDWRSVNIVAEAVAARLSPQVIVAQGLMAGVSEHHMTHLGTLTLRPGTFLSVLNDLIRSMVKAGFQNVLVLNGHGGNIVPCQSNWDQFVREFQVNLHFLSYWDTLGEEEAALLKSGRRIPEDMPGHAQEFETSFALAHFPENLDHDAMAEQADQAPSLATSELGEEMLSRVIDRVSDFVSEMMDGSRSQPVPPFHP